MRNLSRRLRGPLSVLATGLLVTGSPGCVERIKAPAPAPTAALAPQAPAPPQGIPRHVLATKGYVYRTPDRKTQPFVSLPIASTVVVLPEIVQGEGGQAFHRVLGGPGEGGYLLQEELGDVPPTAQDCLARARTALGEGKLEAAVTWGERSTALEARSREAWDLLAAVYDARGDVVRAKEVYAQRAALKPLPPAKEETARERTPGVGETRYIAATRLRARERPSRTARILAELDLNAPVEVLGLSGEFARVAWTSEPKDRWIVLLNTHVTADAAPTPAERKEGYVGAAYLAAQPSSPEALRASAEEAESAGRDLEAARSLERLARLAPGDGPVLERLTRAAARARLYPLAALSAEKRRALGGERSEQPELTLYFGCTQAPPLEPAQACVDQIDTVGTCPPCGPIGPEMYESEGMSKKERRELYASAEREQQAHRELLVEHERQQARLQEEARGVRARYKSGPWMRALVPGNRDHHARGLKVFVYALGFGVSGSCDTVFTSADLEALQLSPQARPWPDEGETLEVWASGTGYEQTIYGIVPAKTLEEARSLIVEGSEDSRQRTSGQPGSFFGNDPRMLAPGPAVLGPWRECICCGC
ncbi:hypothetical protein [Archangium primigenium]|uniref:hypothetical protein n=1 Tax=[Archangium] primigenium TaxID=2792470 RepID=UPI0019574375|nr:hypothetical protein [Archangium primigenium]MBM7117978.1 hypothetical protein [Archangium primigenium]